MNKKISVKKGKIRFEKDFIALMQSNKEKELFKDITIETYEIEV